MTLEDAGVFKRCCYSLRRNQMRIISICIDQINHFSDNRPLQSTYLLQEVVNLLVSENVSQCSSSSHKLIFQVHLNGRSPSVSASDRRVMVSPSHFYIHRGLVLMYPVVNCIAELWDVYDSFCWISNEIRCIRMM